MNISIVEYLLAGLK